MFVIVSGPSGSGKNTVINQLIKRNPQWTFVKSVTTRPPRGENLHIHMTNEQFLQAQKEGLFFESQPMHGDFWVGILNESLAKIEKESNRIFLKDVDVKGTKLLEERFKGSEQLLTIFLDAPDDELARRLKKRGESDDRIKVRLSRAQIERPYKSTYNYVFENEPVQKVVAKIEKIVIDHHKKLQSKG